MHDEGSAPRRWRKSSFSGITECVEVADHDAGVLIRHSKQPAGVVLHVCGPAWTAFVVGVKAGELDR